MKQKINLRLFLIAFFAVLATTIGITVVYYNMFQNRVKNDLSTNAHLLADTGLFQTLYAEAGGNAAEINQDALYELLKDNIRITWISSDGIVLYDNDTDYAGLANHLDRPEIKAAIENGSGESVRRSDTMNLNTFYYALKLDDNTVLRVSTQARSIANVFMMSAPVIIVIVGVVLGICILIGHLLTIQLIKPINTMAEHLDDGIELPVYHELEPFAKKIRIQHERILKAATMRQDFTASVTHELKTPLTAISGYAELIENHLVEEEQEAHIAQEIQNSSQRLLSLINDIIKLSELDHNEIPRKFEFVDLHEVTELCCRDLQIVADRRDVTLTFIGNEGAYLNGDRDLLKELIENLIQNAILYNLPGGWVRVEVGLEDEHAFLKVADNGIGIPKEDQKRIFERFYRVDKSRSRETGGTGLGLAIVKHIAEIHSARIGIESAPGEGTTITLSF